jgi:hypothetical protein
MTGGWYTADSTRERRGGGGGGGGGEEVETAEAVCAPMEEVKTAPVTVVEEAEPWSGTCRHSAQETRSSSAPPMEEPEKAAAVEAPDGVGTPARARCSVQVVAGPRVARPKVPSPRQV